MAKFTKLLTLKVSEDQQKKLAYIMDRKNLKTGTFVRDYIQSYIDDYEKENWLIRTNQTKIGDM